MSSSYPIHHSAVDTDLEDVDDSLIHHERKPASVLAAEASRDVRWGFTQYALLLVLLITLPAVLFIAHEMYTASYATTCSEIGAKAAAAMLLSLKQQVASTDVASTSITLSSADKDSVRGDSTSTEVVVIPPADCPVCPKGADGSASAASKPGSGGDDALGWSAASSGDGVTVDCGCATAYLSLWAKWTSSVRVEPADGAAMLFWRPYELFKSAGWKDNGGAEVDPAACSYSAALNPGGRHIVLSFVQRMAGVSLEALERNVEYSVTIFAKCPENKEFEYTTEKPITTISQSLAFETETRTLLDYFDAVHQAAHACPASCFHAAIPSNQEIPAEAKWHPFLGIDYVPSSIIGPDGSLRPPRLSPRKRTGYDRALDPAVCTPTFQKTIGEYVAWHEEVRRTSQESFLAKGGDAAAALATFRELRDEKGVRWLRCGQVDNSGMNDRFTNTVSAFWAAIRSRRIFLMSSHAEWPELDQLVQGRVVWETGRAFPWMLLLPDSGETFWERVETIDHRPFDHFMGSKHVMWTWVSNRGFLYQCLSKELHQPWFQENGINALNAYGCMQHAFFTPRVGSVVANRAMEGYISLLLDPALYTLSLHVRVGDSVMQGLDGQILHIHGGHGLGGSGGGESPDRYNEALGFFRCATDLSDTEDQARGKPAVWMLYSDSQTVRQMGADRYGPRARMMTTNPAEESKETDASSSSPGKLAELQRAARNVQLRVSSLRSHPPALSLADRSSDSADLSAARVALTWGKLSGFTVAQGPVLLSPPVRAGHSTLARVQDGGRGGTDEAQETVQRYAREAMMEGTMLGLADQFVIDGYSSFGRLPAYASLSLRPFYALWREQPHNRAGMKQCTRPGDAEDMLAHGQDGRTAQV